MALVLDHIGKTAGGDMHLRGIDLTIEPGSFHVILGRTPSPPTPPRPASALSGLTVLA